MKTLSRCVSVPIALAILVMSGGCYDDNAIQPTGAVESISITLGGDTSFTQRVTVLGAGATVTATAELEDRDLRPVFEPVTWSSSNPAVATVPTSTGVDTHITGVSAGTVTISARAGGKTATRQLTVANIIGAADGILFSSARDGNAEIYLLEVSGPRRLTQNAAADVHPTRSGNRIFFSSDRSGNFDIYSMKFDGTDVIRLTTNSLPEFWPTVSSSGQVAFSREMSPGREQIFTMNSLGQNQTNISNNNFHEEQPAWSPDGTRLAYSSDRDRKYGPRQYMEVYSMNADGTGVARLTSNDNGGDAHPAWSPDGSKIAFTTNRSANPTNPSDPTCYDQASEIWVMNANGSGLRNLSNTCRGEAWPSWSPSGSEIVFVSDRGSATLYAWDLWKMPSDGGSATRLTTTGKEATPAWR